MAPKPVRFYLDENLSPEIAVQLRRLGIDCIRGSLGTMNAEHLQMATDLGRVVCTVDDDFTKLAARGIKHAGIIKGEHGRRSIGDWVKYLRYVHAVCSAEELRDEVLFVFPVD
jgi:predicted Ser/Thr protein kinase